MEKNVENNGLMEQRTYPRSIRSLRFLGFDKYVVSNKGIVWSKKRNRGGWKKRKVGTNCWGHRVIYLYKNGKEHFFFVHHLVLRAFIGPCPKGMECLHKNGNPKDNRISNLKWGTKKQNMEDRSKHGRTIRGASHHNCKLSFAQVKEIRFRRMLGDSRKDLAIEFRISKTRISQLTQLKDRIIA